MTDNAKDSVRPASPLEHLVSLRAGDYVLATKYSDGDPMDGWAIGFYAGEFNNGVERRHLVVNDKGEQFRHNGFRRVKKISPARGDWMCDRERQISEGSRSVWWWARASMKANTCLGPASSG